MGSVVDFYVVLHCAIVWYMYPYHMYPYCMYPYCMYPYCTYPYHMYLYHMYPYHMYPYHMYPYRMYPHRMYLPCGLRQRLVEANSSLILVCVQCQVHALAWVACIYKLVTMYTANQSIKTNTLGTKCSENVYGNEYKWVGTSRAPPAPRSVPGFKADL